MTSLLTIGPEQQRLEGRTVRDIVEHDPVQVNEVWCRKIFRQLLQSLELQYAMHMPHRAITPDTVVFHDNGEPLLLPSDLNSPEQTEAADLNALARVVHFAITKELAPEGPLGGRNLEGYSDSLVTAVDRCMSPDPAQRPRTIDELRDILGIVSLGPVPGAPLVEPVARPKPHAAAPAEPRPAYAPEPMPAASAPAFAPAPVPASASDPTPSFMHEPGKRRFGLTRLQRWMVAAGGGAFLVAVALALYAELRDSGNFDHIVLTLPTSGEGDDARQPAAVPPPTAMARLPEPAAQPAPADAAGLPPQATQGSASAQAIPPAPAPAPAAPTEALSRPAPGAAIKPRAGLRAAVAAQPVPPMVGPNGNITYKLNIQPWGVVYVDGVDRGVSPPVKRLTLPPGKHTLRISNPNFHDRVLEVDPASGNGLIAVDFSDEP